LSDIKSAVISRHTSVWNGYTLCWLLFGYIYLGDAGTDRCEILHDGTYWSRTDVGFSRFGVGVTTYLHVLVFHCNYVCVSYCFSDIPRYFSNSR